MNPIAHPLHWKYQKLQFLIQPLLFRNAPQFVYRGRPRKLKDEIPVFTYHVAIPEVFEENCRFLADNGYHTLSADEFASALNSNRRGIENSILLTFDDGLKTMWTVAYPLLKKYGLRAVCFLLPGCIPDDPGELRPNLEDVWEGRAKIDDMLRLGRGPSSLSNWAEIERMHESGVIDFQSHTMYHSLVATSPEIFDFVHPGYKIHFFGNIHIPLYTRDGSDVISREPELGAPVYRSKPRMQADRRFFDDEGLRGHCIDLVGRTDPTAFFGNRDWRNRLRSAVEEYRKSCDVDERYETARERDRAVLDELRQSRQAIEARLAGKSVRHLCFPWYEAGGFAVEMAKQAGFEVTYFGYVNDRTTNRPGDDPFRVVRVEDCFLQRLPGNGRKSLAALFRDQWNLRSLPRRLSAPA